MECVRQDEDGNWKIFREVHVAVVDGLEKQDATANVALLRRSLEIYARTNPSVTTAIIRSDNAGCYHSESNIIPLWTANDGQIKIKRYQFSESGDGKSKADGVSCQGILVSNSNVNIIVNCSLPPS